MSSSSELYVSDYPIFSARNGYDHEIVNRIFLKSDYQVLQRPLSMRNKVTWGDAYLNETGDEIVKIFRSTAQVCKERLELFGASYEAAERDFNEAILRIKRDDILDFTSDPKITYQSYLQKVKDIISSKVKIHGEIFDFNLYTDFDSYLNESELCIEYQSLPLALWSIFHVLEPSSIVEYNLTDVIESGWVDVSPSKQIEIEKIIVLTEGKTDSEFIKAALDFFFPHLSEYYHFMDFENSRYEANASRLVHTIKSFVGSGIRNQIIALFDNDSAAKKEIRNLENVRLPSNIKVLQYPNLNWAKNYPTKGPSGTQYMDVNGLAGSIEMYLGHDCIKKDGSFIPIKWTEYIKDLDLYQGVILEKGEIQKKFRAKVKRFKKIRENKDNWNDLIAVINLMNKAWQ